MTEPTPAPVAPSPDEGRIASAVEAILRPMVEAGLDKLPEVAASIGVVARAIALMPRGVEQDELADRLGDLSLVYLDSAGVRVAVPLHDVLKGSMSSIPALLQTGAQIARLFFPV